MRTRVWLAGMVVVAAACWLPTEACGCTPGRGPERGMGLVAGVVARADGTAIPRASIRFAVSIPGCAAPRQYDAFDPNATFADDAGRYRWLIHASTPADSACVRITARDPVSGDSAVVDGIRMRLVSTHTAPAPDSLRVDLLLP